MHPSLIKADTVAAISDASETVLTLHSKFWFTASALARSACTPEFISETLYIIPNFSVSGSNSFNNWICSFTGLISEVPVTFLPGFSFDSTNPAFTASVTAVNKIGIFLPSILLNLLPFG